ncbi:MAG TPA: membrane dipeptidase [Phycisphaerales bacterium]|nr:membrane dipeptidase [Phycisphaerales bacterium]
MEWFDAHLDLACLHLNGRDLLKERPEGGLWQPGCITLPALRAGGVSRCLATVFTESVEPGAAITEDQQYHRGDAEAAHRAGVRQVDLYDAWRGAGVAPRMGVLMECADPIREPDELEWWTRRGVVAVGMAWAHQSRYAGGNGVEAGLTDLGRALVRSMDALGVVHDASHLSERAFWELCDATDRVIVASHSNCRALNGGDAIEPLGRRQRHLTDAQIREIARRGGVIGLNLFSLFLRPRCEDPCRASVDDCIAHVEHVCALAGNRRCVGLGSDADGGFSALRLPEGIDGPRDYWKLAEALRERGWSTHEFEGFTTANWQRVFPAV